MVHRKGAHTLAQATVHLVQAPAHLTRATAHLAQTLTPEINQDPAATHGQEIHHHHTEGTATLSQAIHTNRSQVTHTNRNRMR
jgi:hypothetical protein